MFSLANDKQCSVLRCFDDSLLVINWMNGRSQLQDCTLIPLGDQLKMIASSFEFLSYTQFFRELNDVADKLSKKRLQVELGCWVVEEFNEGHLTVSHGRF